MGGPWEDYATPAHAASKGGGPWEDYATPQTMPSPAPAPQAIPQNGVVEDVVKSGATGMLQGVNAIPGAIGDISQLSDKALQWLGRKLGFGDVTEEQRRVGEELKARGIKVPNMMKPLAPTSEDIQRAEEGIGIPFHEPTTTAGRYARSIGSLIPATIGGEAGLVRKAASAVLGGTAGEAASEATAGTPYQVPATIAATLLGAGAPHIPSSPQRLAARALEGVSPQEINAAAALMERAQRQGVPLTVDEAVQHVTNGRSGLTDLRRVVQSSRGGGALREIMAERPEAVQAAGEQAIGALRGAGPAPAPAELGPAVQRAAEGEIVAANTARTSEVSPLYEAASTVKIPENKITSIIDDLDSVIRSDATRLTHGPLGQLRSALIESKGKAAIPAERAPVVDARTGRIIRYDTKQAIPAVPEKPILTVENIDRVKKYFRDKTELPAFSPDAIDKETGAKIIRVIDRLDSEMVKTSPDYANAKRLYEDITRRTVEPLTQGPTGELARTADAATQGQALFPAKPLPGSARDLRRTMHGLVLRDPRAAEDIVHSHLRSVFDEQTKALQGGPNTHGGANFAKALAGNSQAAQNIQAVVEALPNGRQRYAGLNNLLETLQATGRAPRQGSATAFNQEIQRELKAGGTHELLHPRQAVIGFAERLRLGLNARQLAKMLTDPRTIGEWRALAQMRPGSERAIGVAARLILRAEAARENRGPQ